MPAGEARSCHTRWVVDAGGTTAGAARFPGAAGLPGMSAGDSHGDSRADEVLGALRAPTGGTTISRISPIVPGGGSAPRGVPKVHPRDPRHPRNRRSDCYEYEPERSGGRQARSSRPPAPRSVSSRAVTSMRCAVVVARCLARKDCHDVRDAEEYGRQSRKSAAQRSPSAPAADRARLTPPGRGPVHQPPRRESGPSCGGRSPGRRARIRRLCAAARRPASRRRWRGWRRARRR